MPPVKKKLPPTQAPSASQPAQAPQGGSNAGLQEDLGLGAQLDQQLFGDPELATPEQREQDRAALEAAIGAWQAAMTEWARRHRDWTLDNWDAFLAASAGDTSVPWGDGAVTAFLTGVWGNAWTDAPDALLDLMGMGLADAAKTASEGFGVLAGGAAGLLVSSVLATLTESVVGAIVSPGPSDEDQHQAADTARGVAVSSAKRKETLQVFDAEQDRVTAEAAGVRADFALMLRSDVATVIDGLYAGAARASAETAALSPDDRSLYTELITRWALLHATSTNTGTDKVNAAAFRTVSQDASLWGEGGLDGWSKGDGRHNVLYTHQARIYLGGAGLEVDPVLRGIGDVTQPRTRSRGVFGPFTVRVVDPVAFERFVRNNWGHAGDVFRADGTGAGAHVRVALDQTAAEPESMMDVTAVSCFVLTGMEVQPYTVSGTLAAKDFAG